MYQIKFKQVILLSITMITCFFYGQKNNYKNKHQLGFAQLDFLSIKMPKNEQNMVLYGVHYNISINSWSYTGLGLYSAVSGIRGGFFTFGVNMGIKPKITNNFFIDSGIHFGGGGGASAPDGSGAFILPHFAFGYNFKKISLLLGYSYINFFDYGKINSKQIYTQLQIQLILNHSLFKNKEHKIIINKSQKIKQQFFLKKTSLLIHANNLVIRRTNLKGEIINLLGLELNSYFKKNFFCFLKADGSYHGIKAGYMNIFIGGGYQFTFNKNKTNIIPKLGIGAGGGGGLNTKGGFLFYNDFSIEQQIFNNIYISLNKGFFLYPNFNLLSSNFGVGIKYYLNKNPIKDFNKKNSLTLKFKGIETIIFQELYFNAYRNNNISQNMQQIGLQINFYFNNFFYGSGQTSFANFGNAGAYGEGLIGLGLKSKNFLRDKISFFGQLLSGAGGGGGISTVQGLIIKPCLGINYTISKKLKLRSSLGYTKAIKGRLSNYFINFGINYNFSFLKTN